MFLLWLSWLELIVLAFVAYTIYMCWHFRHFSKLGIPVDGPRIPFLGTVLPIITKGLKGAGDGLIEKYGKTHGGFSGRLPYLFTVDADIIRDVFIKDFHSFPNRFFFATGDERTDKMISIVGDVDHWKYLRSTMSPTFSSGKLKRMMIQINKCAATFAGHLKLDSQGGKSLEMKEYSGSFTMDVIASTGFGLDINSQQDRNNPFVRNAQNALKFSPTNPIIIFGMLCPSLLPLVTSLGSRLIKKEILDFFADIANQALDARKEDGDEGNVDFLQLMMKAHEEEGNEGKRAMSRLEIIAQAIVFFLAGYDTTATTMSFLAYNLACNPDKQDKLIEEIKSVAGGDAEVIKDDVLHEMAYLEMCVNESLRLYPPAPRLDRVAARDVVLRGGIKLFKGSTVNVPVFHMHRLADIYPNPEAFIPERFSPEEKSGRDPVHFMPFGAGPRQCIASRLAILEIKVAVVHLLKTHKFVKAPETEVPIKFSKFGMLTPENGVWLRLEEQ